MAYKLTPSEKEVANFLRSLNKNIENAFVSFGANSEIYKNLTSFVGQIKAPILTSGTKPYLQVSQSKKALATLIPKIQDIKDRYYAKDGKTIKSFLSVGTQKEIATRVMKNHNRQGKSITLKEAYKLSKSTTLIAELYKEFKEYTHTYEDYEAVYEIMAKLRDETIVTEDFELLKTLSEKELHVQTYTEDDGDIHQIYVNQATGEIEQDINLSGEWIDIL